MLYMEIQNSKDNDIKTKTFIYPTTHIALMPNDDMSIIWNVVSSNSNENNINMAIHFCLIFLTKILRAMYAYINMHFVSKLSDTSFFVDVLLHGQAGVYAKLFSVSCMHLGMNIMIHFANYFYKLYY